MAVVGGLVQPGSCTTGFVPDAMRRHRSWFDILCSHTAQAVSHLQVMSGSHFTFPRYPVYMDAGAYSSNLKQKLAAGSPLLVVTHRCCEIAALRKQLGG